MFASKLLIPFLLCCLFWFSSVNAADDSVYIGYITAVQDVAVTRTETGEKPLQLNDKVFFKQQIITRDNGKVTITFRDGSTFDIAPQSVVVLDDFIFNPSENVLEKSIRVLKGTFRYISGFALKNSKTDIKTPFGVAGIRGSAVEGTVSHKQKQFITLVSSGDVIITTTDGTQSKKIDVGLAAIATDKITDKKTIQSNLSVSKKTIVFVRFFQSVFGQPTLQALTQQQNRENARLNNMPTSTQKDWSKAAKELPIKPEDVKGKELSPSEQSDKTKTEEPVKHVQTLQQHNNEQTAFAMRNTAPQEEATDKPKVEQETEDEQFTVESASKEPHIAIPLANDNPSTVDANKQQRDNFTQAAKKGGLSIDQIKGGADLTKSQAKNGLLNYDETKQLKQTVEKAIEQQKKNDLTEQELKILNKILREIRNIPEPKPVSPN